MFGAQASLHSSRIGAYSLPVEVHGGHHVGMSEKTTNVPVLGMKVRRSLRAIRKVSTTLVLRKVRYIPDPATPAILGVKWCEQGESVGWVFPSSFAI